MIESFASLPTLTQALIATLFTWAVTALGAAIVFVTPRVDQRLMASMNGFAAGVMTAASFWSLLAPAIEMARADGSLPAWIPPTVGFVAGGFTLALIDRALPHLHPGLSPERAEGPDTDWSRSTLLVLAITLHNIPEGLAVGVAFGAAAHMTGAAHTAQLGAAIALAIGIGLQNFPEGTAVSLPLRREGMSRGKALWYGQLSAIVEPVAGVIGAGLVLLVAPVLPYALAFAAGAMIFVVAEELIPDCLLYTSDAADDDTIVWI